MYGVGDKLHWTDTISFDEDGEDVPMDSPMRDAVVTQVDDEGIVYVKFGDGVEDYFPSVNMQDYFERVTWDTMT
jgi:hypothetical protein